MPLRIVFCGTPSIAVPSLERLITEPDIRVEGIVTQPDRPRGRNQELSQSPVKIAALAAGIEVYQPEKVRAPEAQAYFERFRPDCVVIIAYGQIIPGRLIAIPRLGWINVHASLLPKYRGAAPINWAIINGETVTGLTTMQIDAGLDTGPTLLRAEMPIGPDETAPELTARMGEASAPLIVDTLRRLGRLNRGELSAVPQDNSQATLAPPLKKEDGLIDWSVSAAQIYNRIRGLQPWPGAYTRFRGRSCQIWGRPVADERVGSGAVLPGAIYVDKSRVTVACGQGSLLLEFAQMEGRKRVTGREFANGARLAPGERFE
jgi:methionyl-tRNA formyltransferase